MYAVIMAGGGGTRLWPLSRAARPKPFLPLLDGRSLLAATVERIRPLVAIEDIHVVTDGRYAGHVREVLPALPLGNVLAEPVGRNTAAAVALAAAAIDRPADEVMVVLPADQAIGAEEPFRAALAAAAARAGARDMVTLGIRPTEAATGYGYVLATGSPEAYGGWPTFRVQRFEEKPTPERAGTLIDSGAASWNAGIFVWRRDVVRAGLAEHAPDILGPIEAVVADGPEPERAERLAAAYADLRATSIDYALLEPASLAGRVAVVPVDCGWSDLGSWAALREALLGIDEAGSGDGSRGSVLQADDGAEIVEVDGNGLYVHAAGGRLVAVVGLRDVIVVDTPDALLVCAPEAAQAVRSVVARLEAEGRRDLL